MLRLEIIVLINTKLDEIENGNSRSLGLFDPGTEDPRYVS